jgi:hypothetical protein
MAASREQIGNLRASTPEDEIKHRRAPGMGDKTLSYVDARYVMDFLDSAVGPENWQTKEQDAAGGVVCNLGIFCEMATETSPDLDPQWVWKSDVGTASSIEEVKGAHSDAFKRAAVRWGIARDLYDTREDEVAARPGGANAGQGQAQPYAAAPTPAPRPAAPQAVSGASQPGGWYCPVHGQSEIIAGGYSQRTGKNFRAFTKCPVKIDDGSQWGADCPQRPPKGYVTIEPTAQPQPINTQRPTTTLPNGGQTFADHGAMPPGGWPQQPQPQSQPQATDFDDLPF